MVGQSSITLGFVNRGKCRIFQMLQYASLDIVEQPLRSLLDFKHPGDIAHRIMKVAPKQRKIAQAILLLTQLCAALL